MTEQFLELLKDMAQKVGASAAIEALGALFTSLRERLRRTPQSQQRDLVTKWSEELDHLISDLAPAFDLGKDTALPVLIFNMKRGQDAEWRRVSDTLRILQTWFHRWHQQRRATASLAPLTTERLIGDIETLVSIALFTSEAGVEIERWAHDLSPDDRGFQPFKIASQRFDLFLTKLENFLRTLPEESVTPTIAQHRLFPRMSH